MFEKQCIMTVQYDHQNSFRCQNEGIFETRNINIVSSCKWDTVDQFGCSSNCACFTNFGGDWESTNMPPYVSIPLPVSICETCKKVIALQYKKSNQRYEYPYTYNKKTQFTLKWRATRKLGDYFGQKQYTKDHLIAFSKGKTEVDNFTLQEFLSACFLNVGTLEIGLKLETEFELSEDLEDLIADFRRDNKCRDFYYPPIPLASSEVWYNNMSTFKIDKENKKTLEYVDTYFKIQKQLKDFADVNDFKSCYSKVVDSLEKKISE